jgi:hypothetical protein
MRREREAAVERMVEAADKGPIAQLQEFVQGSKHCPTPSNCSILQWSFEDRIPNTGVKVGPSLEFRATVAFLLDGIPHHSMGNWHTSKKLAQRDAAERALRLFVTEWAHYVAEVAPQSSTNLNRDKMTSCYGEGYNQDIPEVHALARHFSSTAMPQWSHTMQSGGFQAHVEIDILGVSHTFSGCMKSSLSEAFKDTARRVMWYLGVSGFEDAFESDPECNVAKDIQAPPFDWINQKDQSLFLRVANG